MSIGKFDTFKTFGVALFATVGVLSTSAFASTSGITYQGRILKPDGSPLSGANVQFKLQIRTPDANDCLMYEEVQALDMRNSNGVFALTMHDGTGTRTDSSGYTIDRIFGNAQGPGNTFTFNPATCSGANTYLPNTSDGRNFVVFFKDETMAAYEPMPAQKINFVPLAFEAKQIAGFTPASLVRVAESDGTLDTVSPLSNANYTELLNLIGGTSAQYAKQSAAAGTVVSTVGGTGNVATPSAGSVWLDTTAGNLKFYDGATVKTLGTAGGSVTSVGTGTGLTGGPITTTGTISLATLGVGGTGFKVTYDTYGRVTGAVALVEADIPTLTTAGHVSGSAITSGTIAGNTAINTTGTISSGAITSSGLITSPSLSSTAIGTQSVQIFETTNSFKVSITAPASLGANYALTLPTTAGASNQVLTTNGSGVLTWTTPAGTGISALTSDISASGTGSVAATVNSVGGVTAANVASGANAANAATNLNTVSTIVKRDGSGNFAASAVTETSTIYKDTGANTVTLQAPTTVTTSYVLKLPPAVAASAGQYLSSDTSGNLSWSTLPSSTAPSGAASGDLSGTYPGPTVATVGTSTAANIHSAELAANSATAVNTASKIVARDVSGNFSANVATVNGVALNNAGSILNITNPVGGAWNMTLPSTAGTSGQVMQTNGSGVMTWMTPVSTSVGFVNGGNSFGANASVGTNDAFRLDVKTNNLARMTVDSSGNVGIGTTAPGAKLDINGNQSMSGTNPQIDFYPVSAGQYTVGRSGAITTLAGPNVLLAASSGDVMLQQAGSNRLRIWGSGGLSVNGYGATDPGAGNTIIAGSVGIGTTAPATKLEIAGTLKVGDGGETCGASYAGGVRYNGGNIQFCNGTSWSTLGVAGSGITALTGDVTASGSGSVAASVANVGGVTAANVASGANLANAATNLNTASTIVKRDASGNFTAGTITSTAMTSGAVTETSTIFKDTGANTVTLSAPTTVTTSYALKLPTAVAASAGQVLASDTSGNMSWSSLPTALPPNGSAGGDLSGTYPNPAVATVGTSTAANIHSAELAANSATALNTSSKIVARDGSGNFAANVATVNGVALNNAGSILNITNPVGGAWNMTLPATAGTSGQVMQTNGSGIMSWTTPLTSSTGFVNGGNSFGAVSNIGNNDNFDLNVKTNNLARMTVTAAGNVGIGTTAPSYKLDVRSTGQLGVSISTSGSNHANPSLQIADSGVSGFMASTDGTTAGLNIGTWSNHPLLFSTNTAGGTPAARMAITPTGNVGIGTTAPAYPLQVDSTSSGTAPVQLAISNSSNAVGTGDKMQFRNSLGQLGAITVTETATDISSDMKFTTLWASSPIDVMTLKSNGLVGIGTTAPATKLDVSGTLKVGDGGETCGASYAGGVRYNGGNIQFCNGTSWSTLGVAGAGITALTGDVTASGTGSVAATVAQVGGVTAANVASGANLANAATNLNTVSTIVKRDGSGNFAASAITSTSNVMKDSGANTVTLSAPTTVTTSYVLKLPTSVAASAGQVLASDTSGNMSWSSLPTALPPNGSAGGDLSGTYPNPTVAAVGTSTAANVHSAELAANAATAVNTSSKIVARDASGNFAAGVGTFNGVSLNNAGSILNITNPIGGAWNMTLPATAGTSGQVMQTNGAGVMSWTTPLTSSTGFINGGNSFGANASIGTNDAFRLDVKTNNVARMTVDNAGNVGIGTTAPSQKLDVAGSINVGSTSAGSWNSLNLSSNRTADGNILGQINFGNALNTVNTAQAASIEADNDGAAGGAKLNFATSNVSNGQGFTRMTITGNGNVGIGTANPVAPLDVNGLVAVSETGGLAFNTYYASGWKYRANGYGNAFYQSSTGDLFLSTFTSNAGGTGAAATENKRIALLNNGNVGFGTTAPASQMHVVSQTAVGPTTTADGIISDNYSNSLTGAFISTRYAKGTQAAPGAVTNNNYLGGYTFTGYDGTAFGTPYNSAQMSSRTTEAWSTTAHGSDIEFYTVPNGSNAVAANPRLVIDQNGNVGIGQNTPTAALHLKAGSATAGTAPLKLASGTNLSTPEAGAIEYDGTSLYYTDSTATRRTVAVVGATAYGDGSTIKAGSGAVNTPGISFANDADTGFYSPSVNANIIGVTAGGSNIFNFSASGLVSPTTGGASVTTANGTAAAPTYSFAGDTGTGWWRPAASTMAASTGGTERMRIGSSGNVGIGTTAPAYPLQVNGNAAFGSAFSNVPAAPLNAVNTGGAGVIKTQLNLINASSTGDGTAIDFWTYDVAGVVNPPVRVSATDDNWSGDFAIWTKNVGDSSGSAALHERFRVQNNGNVGIGTASPTSALQVNGNITPAGDNLSSLGTPALHWNNVYSMGGLFNTLGGATSTLTISNISSLNFNNTNSIQQNDPVSFAETIYTGTPATATMTWGATGNVGIGTTAPNSKIDIKEPAVNTPGLTVQTGGGGTDILVRDVASPVQNISLGHNTTSLNILGANAGAGGFNIVGATSVLNLKTDHADPITLSTNASERMRVDGAGNVGIGTTAPGGQLDVNQATAGSIAIQGQASGTAFWKVLNPAGGITAGWNAAAAVEYVGKDTGTNRSINAAGTINASGADFAEWIDWSGQIPQMGSVVLYRGSYVVVSSPFTAAFVGNDVKDPEHSILVAFAGQLPVLVRGITHEGDLIVANDDGTARAIPKAQATVENAYKAVGTAWSNSSDPGLKRVHVAVGIGLAGGLRDIASIKSRADKLETDNQKLKQDNAAIKARADKADKENAAMKARLDKIEKMLNSK